MANRLPQIGGDSGEWGQILNDYLSTEHNADGTHNISVDASDVTYTPSDNTKWNGSADPGNTNGGLDQLATRVKTVEGQVGAGSDTSAVHTNVSSEISGVTEKTSPVAADLLLIEDSAMTNSKKKVQLVNLPASSAVIPVSGWIPYSSVTPTLTTSDDPSYVITFAGVDLTGIISLGMRVKWTQNSTINYAFVTAISFSTNTTITLYGGTDYNVLNTGDYPISNFYYSPEKAPFGFPLDPTVWTVSFTDSLGRSQASPTTSVWYNLGSLSVTIPIGIWRVSYQMSAQASQTTGRIYATLSTANNSESDKQLTTYGGAPTSVISYLYKAKILNLAAKTVYYFNAKTSIPDTTSIAFPNDQVPLLFSATCVYL